MIRSPSAPTPGGLAFTGVAKRFGAVPVLTGVTLSLEPCEFLALLGASGSGKSTLLRIAAGLEDPDQGDVRIGGDLVNDVPPSGRDVAMVFQDYALYPHLSVRENIALPLRMRSLSAPERLPGARLWPAVAAKRREIEREVRDVAERLSLSAVLGKRPAQLSGGQQQRTALGRAVVRRPSVFLMDEPLSNLDATLRGSLRAEIRRIQRESGAACLYVTHDQVEAMTMADRIAVLSRGEVLQAGTPRQVYADPVYLEVLELIGSPRANVFTAQALAAESGQPDLPHRCTHVAVRPEDVHTAHAGPRGEALAVRATATGSEDHGHCVWRQAVLAATQRPIGWIERDAAAVPQAVPGERIELFLPRRRLLFFDARGERIGRPAEARLRRGDRACPP